MLQLLLFICAQLLSSVNSLRVLVVTIDHRELDGELRNASHQSLSAVINYNYAKLHGYDYKYYHPVINESDIFRRYGLRKRATAAVGLADAGDPTVIHDSHEGGETGAALERRRRRKQALAAHHSLSQDEAPTAFHPGLKEFRGSSWCRLPTLWHLSKQYADKYDALFVIDSDLVISAVHQNATLEQKLKEWQSRVDGITWGPKDLSKAGLIFFPNSPFGNWEPATGVLVIQPKLHAAEMIKEWWDFEWPEKAFSLMHEQDALWRVYQWTPQTVFTLNQANTAMVSERQFPVDMSVDEWCFRKGWICHVSHSWGKDRNRVFHRILHSEVVHHSTKARISNEAHQVGDFFRETIALIRAQEVQFDVVKAAEEMELQGGQRKRIGNHVAQGSSPPPPPPPPPSPGSAASASAVPTPTKEFNDPEERNNEFHNLNPSTVEEPDRDKWVKFKAGMSNLVGKMKALKNAATQGESSRKNAMAAALHRNFSLGTISFDSFERDFATWSQLGAR